MKKFARVSTNNNKKWSIKYVVGLLILMLGVLMIISYAIVLLRSMFPRGKRSQRRSPALETAVEMNEFPSENYMAGVSHKGRITIEQLDSGVEGDYHYIFDNADNAVICPSRRISTGETEMSLQPIHFSDGMDMVIHAENISYDRPHFAQLCLAQHLHHHAVEITAVKTVDDKIGHCLLFVSLHSPRPSRQLFDFKADKATDENSITLHTYMSDFIQAQAKILHLSVRTETATQSSTSMIQCTLKIKVTPVKVDELVRVSPALRGGQILMAKDVEKLINQ
jgi:hypothetical protein